MEPKKKVKAKKSKKKSKSSEKETFEKQVDDFIKNESLHKLFIERMGNWILSHYARVIDIFRKFDRDGDGQLSYEEFFSGMKDLHVPCNQLELCVLAKTVDQNGDGRIEYAEFSRYIRYRRPIKVEIDNRLPVLKIERERFDQCSHCGIKKWNFKDKFSNNLINVNLIFHSMKSISDFPGHIKDTVVEIDMTVHGLQDIILSKLDFSFNNIIIFTMEDGCKYILKKEQTVKMILKTDSKIEIDKKENDNNTITLFYEIGKEDLSNCPIIQSDYYFKR